MPTSEEILDLFYFYTKNYEFRKNKTKRYFNLLIEFRDQHQGLKMPRDYCDLQLGQESAGTSGLPKVPRGACWEIQVQLKKLPENPFRA